MSELAPSTVALIVVACGVAVLGLVCCLLAVFACDDAFSIEKWCCGICVPPRRAAAKTAPEAANRPMLPAQQL